MILLSTLFIRVEKTKKILDAGWKSVKMWINIFTFYNVWIFSMYIQFRTKMF